MKHACFVDGSQFPEPVSKVVCVGRNYAAHAKELNNPVPVSPLLFIKPNTAVVSLAGRIAIPECSVAVHFETELAVLIGAPLCKATREHIKGSIAGIGIGLDLTLRDVQAALKKQGHPWEKSKAFDGSCPLSEFVPYKGEALDQMEFQLSVNGVIRQVGKTKNMLMSVEHLLSEISRHFSLLPGDVVLTGTPSGVGVLGAGDELAVSGFGPIAAQCVVEAIK